MKIKYPKVVVKLEGEDGNAILIISRVRKALKKAGVSAEEIELFRKEATSGNYEHLLQVVMDWVSVDKMRI